MFIVKGIKGELAWVAAVIKDKEEAKAYVEEASKREGESFSIQSIYLKDFPFVIVDKHLDGFNRIKVMAPIVADKLLRKLHRVDGTYTFYPVTEQFVADPPGENKMGDWSKFEALTKDDKENLRVGLKAIGI